MARAVTIDEGNIISGLYDISLGATALGAVEGDVTVSREADTIRFKSAQSVGTLATKESDVRYYIRCDLGEATLTNLYKAWNQPVATLGGGGSSLSIEHTPGSELAQAALTVVGPAPGTALKNTWTFDKVDSMGVSEHKFTVNGFTMIPVQFEALAEVGATGVTTWGCVVEAAE